MSTTAEQVPADLAAGWVDSHCHVYDERMPGGPDEAVAAAHAAGVSTMVAVGCDRATSLAALEAADRHEGVAASVGLHPHEATNGVDEIVDLLDRPGVLAIGEAGLDYYYEHSPRDTQREAFAAQIQLAHERRLPLIIHTRDAWDDTFDVLAAEGTPERTVFHCFTGGPDEAARALDVGAFLSFSGIVTFPSATDLQAAAAACPADRALIETDSPYLAPAPHRGKRNHPAWVALVGEHLARLRGTSVDEVRASTAAAAMLAFPGLGS